MPDSLTCTKNWLSNCWPIDINWLPDTLNNISLPYWRWDGRLVSIATGYGLDGPGIESRCGEIFRTCPDRPWGPPSLLYNVYRVFPGDKKRPGREANPHPLLVPWSRKSRAIPIIPLWAVRPVQKLSACTRVHFTYIYLYPSDRKTDWLVAQENDWKINALTKWLTGKKAALLKDLMSGWLIRR